MTGRASFDFAPEARKIEVVRSPTRLAPLLALITTTALSTVAACSSKSSEWLGSDHAPDTGGAGFCRSTTCVPPKGVMVPTAEGLCEPPGWAESDDCKNHQHASNAPLWWRSQCVGYDINQTASRHIAYDKVAIAVRGAFDAWINASCPMDTETGRSRASIDVRDLGAVICDRHVYNSDAPNQNVITFHDDSWPYEAQDDVDQGVKKSLTIALTRVTFEPQTGEIYDADIELNSADYTLLTEADPSHPDSIDLQTVLTHEAGHFLGLAHSPDPAAVMYASADNGGSSRKRELTMNDVHGICAIYPPSGVRSVSSVVDPSGKVAASACDPTPRHGFSSSCD